ncbi:MAG: polyhydroxyalkanoate synthesis repressor PhaR [Steroidobacteraceae bacterium]
MSEPRVIKKYPNRRLYDTVESRYITLADVRRLVLEKIDFLVIDKKTQEDITRSILLQVISEQEHNGEPLMSQDFLSQIIRSYGGAMQSFVGAYLEQSLKMFQNQQSQMRDSAGADPISAMAALTQRNLERWRAIQDDIFRAMTSSSPASRPRDPPPDNGSDEDEPPVTHT